MLEFSYLSCADVAELLPDWCESLVKAPRSRRRKERQLCREFGHGQVPMNELVEVIIVAQVYKDPEN